MKLADLVSEIKRRAKRDKCAQLSNLLAWVEARQPSKAEYDRARYSKQKAAREAAFEVIKNRR